MKLRAARSDARLLGPDGASASAWSPGEAQRCEAAAERSAERSARLPRSQRGAVIDSTGASATGGPALRRQAPGERHGPRLPGRPELGAGQDGRASRSDALDEDPNGAQRRRIRMPDTATPLRLHDQPQLTVRRAGAGIIALIGKNATLLLTKKAALALSDVLATLRGEERDR